jgi:hypothetical protein
MAGLVGFADSAKRAFRESVDGLKGKVVGCSGTRLDELRFLAERLMAVTTEESPLGKSQIDQLAFVPRVLDCSLTAVAKKIF